MTKNKSLYHKVISLQELFIDFLSNMSKDTKVGFSAGLFNYR